MIIRVISKRNNSVILVTLKRYMIIMLIINNHIYILNFNTVAFQI